jgi:hypothetical protein
MVTDISKELSASMFGFPDDDSSITVADYMNMTDVDSK